MDSKSANEQQVDESVHFLGLLLSDVKDFVKLIGTIRFVLVDVLPELHIDRKS